MCSSVLCVMCRPKCLCIRFTHLPISQVYNVTSNCHTCSSVIHPSWICIDVASNCNQIRSDSQMTMGQRVTGQRVKWVNWVTSQQFTGHGSNGQRVTGQWVKWVNWVKGQQFTGHGSNGSTGHGSTSQISQLNHGSTVHGSWVNGSRVKRDVCSVNVYTIQCSGSRVTWVVCHFRRPKVSFDQTCCLYSLWSHSRGFLLLRKLAKQLYRWNTE